MNGQYHYAVVGAGRQGVAAAYDMAKWGDAASILLADANYSAASQAAERIAQLTGHPNVSAAQVDVLDHNALVECLKPVDVFLCGTPFRMIPLCMQAAVEAQTSMVDLGGHTDTVLRQLAMHDAVAAAGVTVVPDCGMGPGMNNTLGVYAVEQLQGAARPRVRCGFGMAVCRRIRPNPGAISVRSTSTA
ncbi:MAG: saccharopine dehydrogenase NADP-binding domain-containing protein [Anaerolineae bacterium]|nr:saccharopine dehydrogenase NADP-binding domain-containing protein [Anaerolineae bacterium]